MNKGKQNRKISMRRFTNAGKLTSSNLLLPIIKSNFVFNFCRKKNDFFVYVYDPGCGDIFGNFFDFFLKFADYCSLHVLSTTQTKSTNESGIFFDNISNFSCFAVCTLHNFSITNNVLSLVFQIFNRFSHLLARRPEQRFIVCKDRSSHAVHVN